MVLLVLCEKSWNRAGRVKRRKGGPRTDGDVRRREMTTGDGKRRDPGNEVGEMTESFNWNQIERRAQDQMGWRGVFIDLRSTQGERD